MRDMKTRVVRISEEAYQLLAEKAEGFETPSEVIVRLLKDDNKKPKKKRKD